MKALFVKIFEKRKNNFLALPVYFLNKLPLRKANKTHGFNKRGTWGVVVILEGRQLGLGKATVHAQSKKRWRGPLQGLLLPFTHFTLGCCFPLFYHPAADGKPWGFLKGLKTWVHQICLVWILLVENCTFLAFHALKGMGTEIKWTMGWTHTHYSECLIA